jgi:hypothetical protein
LRVLEHTATVPSKNAPVLTDASPTCPWNVGDGAVESQFLHVCGDVAPLPSVPVQYCVGEGTPMAVAIGVLSAVGVLLKNVGTSFDTTVPAMLTTSIVVGTPAIDNMLARESPE